MDVDLIDEIALAEQAPLPAERLADGTRSKVTTAPPPIPARAARKSSASLPPPLPQRAARGTEGPSLPRPQTMSSKVSLVAPRASAEMMASWQINPEAPLAAAPMVTPIALVRAPSAMVEAPIPSPRESRVEPLPTTQPGADIADLPAWPVRTTQPLPLPGRATSRAPRVSTRAMPSVLVAPAMAEPSVSPLDGSDAWVFEEDYEERRVDGEVVPTTYFERTETGARMRPRYLIAAGAAAAAVALIVGMAIHSSADSASRPPLALKVPAPDVAPRLPAPPPAQPVAATPGLTLPITSWPSGAVVTLVDNGAPTVLGPTPVNAALDPSHSYDVMLAVAGRPTTLRHVDLATMHELAVDLDADASPGKVPGHGARQPVAGAPAPALHRHHHYSAPVATIVTPSFDTPVPAPKATQVAMAGNGTLMISAKPPCEIIIDGTSTHLTTPQRSIPLAAGAHAVTLVNASLGIKKTIAVKVDAQKPTKLIQDFTKG
ncbi:hypothetical protein BH11MYX1_BH11MYX1_13580 [soil metagenome]